MAGPSARLDPLYHAYRGDLADIALADRLFAPHYAKALPVTLAEPASLRKTAGEDGEELAALAAGDAFGLLDVTAGWAWGYRISDHLVGYVPASRLSPR